MHTADFNGHLIERVLYNSFIESETSTTDTFLLIRYFHFASELLTENEIPSYYSLPKPFYISLNIVVTLSTLQFVYFFS